MSPQSFSYTRELLSLFTARRDNRKRVLCCRKQYEGNAWKCANPVPTKIDATHLRRWLNIELRRNFHNINCLQCQTCSLTIGYTRDDDRGAPGSKWYPLNYNVCQKCSSIFVIWKYFRLTAFFRLAQKGKPLPNYQKIVLKPVNEIRFIRQIKVWIKHYNSIRRH